jgi:hypothetical protein
MDGNLRLLFRQNLPEMHWQSVETGAVGPGVPDSNYCYKGAEGWVEFKVTSGWAVTLRPAQIGWLLRRARAGGRVFVAVRQRDTLWLAAGGAAVALREAGLRGAPTLGHWEGGPSQWPWTKIRRLLTLTAATDPGRDP